LNFWQARLLAELEDAMALLRQKLRGKETALLTAQTECSRLVEEMNSKVCFVNVVWFGVEFQPAVVF
jgi:hypothetical protein